ncbi:MAG: hypothetical protein M1818_007781 [Claussenomyces sp. TS43310]|nr:MAG: hypothetical protein M1818_007781 [Claussenomyces sp. TS43310]
MAAFMECDELDTNFDMIDFMLQFDGGAITGSPDLSTSCLNSLPSPTNEVAPSPLPAPVLPLGPKRRRPRTLKQPAAVPPTRRRPRCKQPDHGVQQRNPPVSNSSSLLSETSDLPPSLMATMDIPLSMSIYFPPSPPSTVPTSPASTKSLLDTAPPSVMYNFINNQMTLSKSHVWSMVYDPASRKLLTRVPDSSLAEIQSAVIAAKESQQGWRQVPYTRRRSKLLKLAEVIRHNITRISICLCSEAGSTLQDASDEIMQGIDLIEAACTLSNDVLGSHSTDHSTQTHTIYEPLGVCMTVTTFSHPFMTPLRTIPFAIITGNTVVLKPSEQCPSAAMILADCFLQADFPTGILNVVHGGAAAVSKLLSQPAIRAVSFVGSDIAAERVNEHAIATRKRIQADCSSKNHGVVMEDAAKEQALQTIVKNAFGSAGQNCNALSVVIFVGSSSSCLERLVEIASSKILGCGSVPGVEIGPLISAAAKARVEEMIQIATDEGATLMLDGRNPSVPDYPCGNFVGPTILSNVQPYMQCYQTEIFGPVLSCLTVNTLDEAIEIINDNRYGNSCSIFTSSPVTAQKFQLDVNVGQVYVNVPASAPLGQLSQTSHKDSFLGDVTGHGKSGWQFFTQTKTITSSWQF